jgi:hypothetical protein
MKLFKYLISHFLFCLTLTIPSTGKEIPNRQQVNNSLKVKLLDDQNAINVEQSMEYINNSGDTLHEIYIHLWANAFKNNKSQFARQLIRSGNYDFHFASEDKRGGYTFITFEAYGRKLGWGNYQNNEDIAILYLDKPALPSDTLLININYSLVFPHAGFSRPGQHEGAFYATQWYPKPAVYDRNGWNPIPYLHRGEFYSEFGDYEVSITLPSDYIVASSGILQNEDEIDFLNQLAYQTALENTDLYDVTKNSVPPSEQIKTLHFRQTNIHDFAWFADRKFRVLIDSTLLKNGQSIKLYSFFTHDAHHWIKANQHMGETLQYMSDKLGPYPWEQCTAVQGIHSGGANMEYPAITIIDKRNSARAFEEVIVHEVIHNWFYGILASNERKEPWIDEGFTTYYENRFFDEKYPGRQLLGSFSHSKPANFFRLSHLNFESIPYLYYMLKAAQHLDQPAGATTEELSEMNYYIMAYYKSAMLIKYLEEYLGTEKFDNTIKEFYMLWKFNHPSSVDIQSFFESNTSTDWFFKELINTNKKADIRLDKIEEVENGYLISLSNRGQISFPFPISALKDGTESEMIWFEKFDNKTGVFFPGKDYDTFSIDHHGLIPEINRSNNSIRTSGLLRKQSLPELQFLASIDDPHKPRIYWIPVIGYNANDGFMPGLAFYNYVFPVARNDFFFMPFYSTGRDDASGTAWYYRDFYPTTKTIHSVRAGSKIKRYGLMPGNNSRGYYQLKSSLKATLTPSLSGKRTETSFQFTNYMIWRDSYVYTGGISRPIVENYYANSLDFSHFNESTFNPYKLDVEVLQADQMLRTSLTAKASFPLNANKKGLHLRFFAGTFLMEPSDPTAPDFRFSLQGASSTRDPLYEQTFLGTNKPAGSFFGNQITETYGNFRFPTPLGLTWKWLTALNITYDLPLLPLRVFMDTGTYSGASKDIIGTKVFPYVAGLQASFFRDAIQVNIPLIVSDDIKKIAELNKLSDFYQRITFMIRFEKINPLQMRRKLHLLLN